MRSERRRNTIESLTIFISNAGHMVLKEGVGKRGARTEYELFRPRQHVQRECDFVLVALALQPA